MFAETAYWTDSDVFICEANFGTETYKLCYLPEEVIATLAGQYPTANFFFVAVSTDI